MASVSSSIAPEHARSDTDAARPAATDEGAVVEEPMPRVIDSHESDHAIAATVPNRPWALVAAVIVAAIVAGAVGLFIGRSVHAPNAPDRPESLASNSDFELRVPASWLRTTPDIAPPMLGLSGAIVIAADSPQGAGVVAGTSSATGSTLLEPSTLRRLNRRPRQEVGERLGSLDAYRYANLKIRGFAGRMTLFVAPTSIGVVTLGCFTAGPGTPQFRQSCRSVAQSVRLRREGRAYPLGPARSYQRSLNGVLKQLNVARRRDRAALMAARTRQGQAALADRVGAAFRVARARMADIGVSPRELAAHRQILRGLARASDAYKVMAGAARRASHVRYGRAARAVARAERGVKDAIGALARLGYP